MNSNETQVFATRPFTALPRIGSLWIGAKLSFIEQMSLLSFLEHGHEVTLFTTQKLQGIPPGVTVRDANEIFSCQHILRDHRSGSPALHADMFRYAMLAQTDLTWVDMDVLCLQAFTPSSPYIFGYEDADTVNNAVLRLPRDSLALQQLLQYQPSTRGYPPFFSRSRRVKYWIKSGGRTPHITRWPWGAIGPRGLTYHLNQTGEIRHALPQAVFYSVSSAEVLRLITAPDCIGSLQFPEQSRYLHLWGKQLRIALTLQELHPGSFLAQEKQRLTAACSFHFED